MRLPSLAAPGVAALAALALAAPGCFDLASGVEPADYLTARYATWHVEVDYSSGQRPDDSLLRWLDDRLTPLVRKPGGVTLQHDDALNGSPASWSDAQLRDFSRGHRSFKTGGDQVVTHLLFLSGHYAGDSADRKVLGATFGHDLVVIFPESIRSGCTLATLCTDANPMIRATTLHEFGHALGLVDNGIAMVRPHEDPDHPGHSTNRNSVMYWAVETSDITTLVTGGIPDSFDRDDRDDLRAAGGA